MTARTLYRVTTFVFLAGLVSLPAIDPRLFADDKAAQPDVSDFRTVDKAITTRISMASSNAPGRSGYLGVNVETDGKGKLAVADVESDSPAAKAGLRKGDVLTQVDGQEIANAGMFREVLQSKTSGNSVKLALLREDKPIDVTATLAATSRPMKIGQQQRALLGVVVGEPKEGSEGVPITELTADMPAEKAKIKVGEAILKIDGVPMNSSAKVREYIAEKNPGDSVTLTMLVADKAMDMKIKLAGEAVSSPGDRRNQGWDNRLGGNWKKDVYRLAVIGIEYPDTKHSDKISTADWEKAYFSKGVYTGKNVAGQTVYGSLNDYYLEQSYGKLRVEGKMFNWVEVSKKRADYSEDSTSGRSKAVLLSEALDKLYERDGKDALKDFDGIFFLYAGQRFQTNRGGLYWPHRASFTHQGKRWAYFITSEGGSRMADISVACHEFGHMLGLPDLYARPENPGSTGLGAWCAMSNEASGGKPQHFSAWCKEQLGWLQPAVIDPTVKQKLILAPVEDSPKECIKVLIKLDGSEYLLLENRRKKGFDQSIPAEGLLIWRIVGNHPILEESHGIDGPSGPRVFPNAIPYPSTANNAFTPFTTPSSRSQLGGGLPVHITNIRKLPDGKVTFYVGYEYQ